jgi:hypothetical protein
MSKSRSRKSEAAEGGSTDRFVLDFLYNDSRRIGSFLAQFEPGHLQRYTQTREAERARQDTSERSGKGKIPGLAEGEVSAAQQVVASAAEAYERVFDPYWSNPRAFLDHLSEHNLIRRDIEEASIGQFVLVKGALIIADLQMLHPLWGMPAIQNFMLASHDANQEASQGSRSERRQAHAKQRQQPSQKRMPSEVELVMALLPHMPHAGHIHIVSDDFAVWAPVAEGAMVTPMADLVLKHGPKVAGEWSLLGILDALPFRTEEAMTEMEIIRTGMISENVSKVALQLAPYIRQAFGRPLLSYGMTPLLLFREVS